MKQAKSTVSVHNCLCGSWSKDRLYFSLISGFRRDVDVICSLLGNYTASCGNYLPTFRDNVSVPSSWVKIPRWKAILDSILES